MMEKHTPGPWQVDVPPEGGVVVCDEEGAVLLRFEDYDEEVLDEDALLVAAAPELLSACKALIERFGMMSDGCIKMGGEAIAKAEGRD